MRNRNISEVPERWVILNINNGYYKVFGSWTGGYLYGDRWRLNSGIKKVEQDENFYYIFGLSGSCYKCHKKGYGISNQYGVGILEKILKESEGKIKLMENQKDWTQLIK